MVASQASPGLDGLVGGGLGAQVGREHRIGCGVVGTPVGADRRDHQVAADPGVERGVGQQDRGVPVDGLLARRAAAGSRARGEHHGVGAPHVLGHLGDRRLLQVHHHGLGTGGLQIRDLRGVADQTGDGITARRKQPLQDQRDLSVPARDHDPHVITSIGPTIGSHA